MTYRANAFLRRLDRIAEYTGVPSLARQDQRGSPLALRVAALLMLAVACVGLYMQTRFPMSGYLMTMVAWISSMPLHAVGPLQVPAGGTRDEYQRMLIRAGHFAGMTVVAMLAIGGCFLIAIAGLLPMLGRAAYWTPHEPMDWLTLGFFLLAVETNVALLVASWTMPRRPLDDEG